jgi:hypothetical protein
MKAMAFMLAIGAASIVAGCERGPDSPVVCSAQSRESAFARSLTKSQLQALYSDSMRLMSSADRKDTYQNQHPTYPRIPDEFAYLNPIKIRADNGHIGIMLKGCMDAFIYLVVEDGKIVLSYSNGSAVDMGEEVLWSAANNESQK